MVLTIRSKKKGKMLWLFDNYFEKDIGELEGSSCFISIYAASMASMTDYLNCRQFLLHPTINSSTEAGFMVDTRGFNRTPTTEFVGDPLQFSIRSPEVLHCDTSADRLAAGRSSCCHYRMWVCCVYILSLSVPETGVTLSRRLCWVKWLC